MSRNAEEDARSFGQLVRERREALGWSQEALAAAAFPGSTNKGYISRIENGKVPNVTRETVRNIARALGIEPENIPAALRWPGATAEVKNTNTIAHEIQDQLARLIAAKEDLSREFGIKEGMLIALARRYAEDNPRNFDAALLGLERALEVARDERERGRLSSNTSDAVDAIISRINVFNEEGDLEAGKATLDAELALLDKEDQYRRAARLRLHQKGVAQAIMIRSVSDACHHTISTIKLKAASELSKHFELLIESFLDWYDTGLKRGLNFDVEVALCVANGALSHAVGPVQRGIARNCLGFAHRTLGEREAVQRHLRQAIGEHRMALTETSSKQDPLVWASAQHGLGTALVALGERGGEQQIFKDAIVALRSALSVRTREESPASWAESMHVLGIAYAALAERGGGITQIRKAISLYRAALEERMRSGAPDDWASTKTSLGNALLTLGRIENNMAILEEAADSFSSALEIRTREREPLGWASTQYNLGIAFFTIGGLDGGSTRLKDSIVAYRSALTERTRERVPLDWANTLLGLGATLSRIGRNETDTKNLHEAAAAYRSALEEITVEQAPIDWAIATGNLGTALAVVAQRTNDGNLIEDAISRFNAARSVFQKENYADYLVHIDDQIRNSKIVRSQILGS